MAKQISPEQPPKDFKLQAGGDEHLSLELES